MIRFSDEWNDALSVDDCEQDGHVRITFYPNNNPKKSHEVLLSVESAVQLSKELKKTIAKAKEVKNV